MLELKTKLDQLSEYTSYNFFNYKKEALDDELMRSLVEEAILEVKEPAEHIPHSKETSLYMFRLYRTVPELFAYYDNDEYKEVLLNVFDVLCQEVKYGLKLSLSYEEIVFLLKALK